MQHHTTSHYARRFLSRGLATGLLFTQSALLLTAQNNPTPPATEEVIKLDAFVVSGIRYGIEQAVVAKRENVAVIESVAAEDIGKLPDISIAESIARLPGLAAQRVAGRAQVISVRGLSPDFANTLLNGREQVSTGDNRGVEFDQYPSELMARVMVYKTPDAALVGQGLSGTFDLQTVKPLSYGRRTIALNARYETNSLDDLGAGAKNSGNRLSATYIDQFADKTFGVALGWAHLENPIVGQESGTYGWNTNGRNGVPVGTFGTDGLKTFARTGTNTRDGFIGVFQWRPTANFSSIVDVYYSKFRREETARGIETHIGGYNNNESNPAPSMVYSANTITNGAVLASTVAGVNPLVRALYNDRTDKLTAIGWNNEYRLNDWILVGDLSYSKADRKELGLEAQAHYRDTTGAYAFDTVTYNLATGDFPRTAYGRNYADLARVQVGNTIYGAGYGKVPSVLDKLTSYKISASRSFERFFSNVEFGINYGDRSKDKAQPEASLNAAGAPKSVTDSLRLGDTKLGFGGAGNAISWSMPELISAYYQPFNPSSTAFSYLIPKTWRVDEEILTYYAQGNLDRDLGNGVKLRGNIGVQVKDVDQSSTSNFWNTATNSVKVNRDGKSYTDFLPSMNLAFDFDNAVVVRAAAAKQMARPRLDQLKSAVEFGIDTSTRVPGASGGNPRLDPWKATAYDLSVEKYFAKNKGYVAIAGFYKKLDSYIYDQTDPSYDFTSLIASSGSPIVPIRNTGSFSGPLNGRGGSLKGMEATISLPFSLFSEALDGFGLVASYSNTSSNITVDQGASIALPGLSKTVTNITVYYEKQGFSARVSRRDRSDFIGEVTAFGADRALRYVAGEDVIDAQVGYEFKDGALKGLGVMIQAYNLTDSEYRTYRGTKDRIEEYQQYGRTLLFGANYKF